MHEAAAEVVADEENLARRAAGLLDDEVEEGGVRLLDAGLLARGDEVDEVQQAERLQLPELLDRAHVGPDADAEPARAAGAEDVRRAGRGPDAREELPPVALRPFEREPQRQAVRLEDARVAGGSAVVAGAVGADPLLLRAERRGDLGEERVLGDAEGRRGDGRQRAQGVGVGRRAAVERVERVVEVEHDGPDAGEKVGGCGIQC